MDFKVFLSAESVKFLDACVEKSKLWHFDAINRPMLIAGLIFQEESHLASYLYDEWDVANDDFDGLVPYYLSLRQQQLEIKEGEEGKFHTQSELENVPQNHVPENGETPQEDDKKSIENPENTTPEEEKEEPDGTQSVTLKVKDGKIIEVSIADGKKKVAPKAKAEEKKQEYKTEHDADVIFKDKKGKEHWYPVSNDVLELVSVIIDICKENNTRQIDPIHFVAALFRVDDNTLKEMMKDFEVEYESAKRYFSSSSLANVGLIPYELASFMTCLNDKIDTSKPCEILLRDKEVKQIWNISLKMNKRNTIIVGEPGVGKSALVDKIAYDIKKKTCPKRFRDFVVISLDVNSLIAGTKYRGDAEARIKNLIEFLEKHDNVILFIDEVHTILGAGACVEGEMDLANALKPILARGDTIVIGATTESEYERYFKRDAALSRRFERVTVDEPTSEKVYPMIRNKIRRLAQFHEVTISKSMVEYAIMIANCFAFDKKNPDKTLDLIDRSMVAAQIEGKAKVDKASILANFGIFYELFDSMDENSRKEVAYHEAGHYLVGKLSGRLINFNMLAVSIMPAEDYLGVTCFEYRKDRMPFSNLDYYIDRIAFDLGGRVAEKVFRGTVTSGASQDLINATSLAHTVIAQFGMLDADGIRNNIIMNTEEHPMFSEKEKNRINDEVSKLVERAYARAEQIVNDNRKLLEAIVSQLLSKKIMSEAELDKICKQYERPLE